MYRKLLTWDLMIHTNACVLVCMYRVVVRVFFCIDVNGGSVCMSLFIQTMQQYMFGVLLLHGCLCMYILVNGC